MLDLNVSNPPDRFQDFGDFLCFIPQHFQVVTKELNGGFGTNSRNQFVDPLLNRLADEKRRARHPAQTLPELLHEFWHGTRRRPLIEGLQPNHRIAFIRLLRVVTQLCPPDFRHHCFNFGELHNRLLHTFFDFNRSRQRHTGQANRLRGHRPFIQNRDELRSQRWDQRQGTDQRAHGHHHDRYAMAECPVKDRCIETFGLSQNPRILLASLFQHERTEHW